MDVKCEYCDSIIRNVPDNGTCPNCGAVLTKSSTKEPCLEDYYFRYQPSRLKAIKALRRDTGLGLVEAKEIIDQLFDKKSGITGKTVSGAWQILKDSIKK